MPPIYRNYYRIKCKKTVLFNTYTSNDIYKLFVLK